MDQQKILEKVIVEMAIQLSELRHIIADQIRVIDELNDYKLSKEIPF